MSIEAFATTLFFNAVIGVSIWLLIKGSRVRVPPGSPSPDRKQTTYGLQSCEPLPIITPEYPLSEYFLSTAPGGSHGAN